MFIKDKRPAVLAEQPGLTPTEQGRELGRRWHLLDAAGRALYETLARDLTFGMLSSQI
jgi:hypothetical protein